MSKIKKIKIEYPNGNSESIGQYAGKSLLLMYFFKGSWCNRCKRQIQDFSKNLEKFSKHNIKLLMVSQENKLYCSLMYSLASGKFPIVSDVNKKIWNLLHERKNPYEKSSLHLIKENETYLIWEEKEVDERFLVEDVLKNVINLKDNK